ncbi:MAG TPA: ATP-dependent DNA helicase RecG, partial [Spirochaetota bacterium]
REEARIATIEDLVYYAPRRYLDRSHLMKISDCRAQQEVTVSGKVVECFTERKGRTILHVVVSDGTDSLNGIFFGGIPYYQKLFTPGENVLLSGKVDIFRGIKQIVHPDYDFFDDDPAESVHTARIIPVYRLSEKLRNAGFSSRVFRRLIHSVLEESISGVEDPLPAHIIERRSFPSLSQALSEIHFPKSFESLSAARARLAYNELFFLQYFLALSRGLLRSKLIRSKRVIDTRLLESCVTALPFELTSDQKKVIGEIADDLAHPFPMNRLLQGDVGSGKTVVALASSLIMSAWGKQSAIMAPTELLAIQHYATFSRFAPPEVKIELLTGSTKVREKKRIIESVANGQTHILIGTHALIEDPVTFHDLGFVIIDEQHRFGVNQRSLLHQKGNSPDLLVMTATPIPRSLTLTLYGDLDLSLILEKPKGRLPIKTIILSEDREKGLHASLEKYISEGRQCYYILPLIKESEKMDLASATEMHKKFAETIFRHRSVALLHGKIPSDEK